MACKKTECGCGCQVVGMAHIGVIVKDIKKSQDYYTDLLGFECYHEADIEHDDGITKLAFLRCGTCEIELVQPSKYQPRKDGPVDHIALQVNDIDGMMACLAKKGIQYDTKKSIELPKLFDNGVKYIFFRGPDGERIELSERL